MVYMLTFGVYWWQMSPYIAYMDPMGYGSNFITTQNSMLDQVMAKVVFLFPQTVWPHWGVLTVTVKARCLIEVVAGASGIFPVNFCTRWLLWNVHVHFDCAGSHKTMSPELSVIFPLNFHARWLWWNVRVHFDGAGSHKPGVAGLAAGIFPVNFCTKWLLRNVHVYFDLGIGLPPRHHPPQHQHLPPPPPQHPHHHLPLPIFLSSSSSSSSPLSSSSTLRSSSTFYYIILLFPLHSLGLLPG